MRQAGILAACGIVSLTKMVDRLADDHARARRLATSLFDLPGINVEMDSVQTNLILVTTERSAEEWLEALAIEKVHCLTVAPRRFRLVLHADIDDAQVDRAAMAIKKVAGAFAGRIV